MEKQSLEANCVGEASEGVGRRVCVPQQSWQAGNGAQVASKRAGPFPSRPCPRAPLHHTQHKMKPFLPLCYLFVWCMGRPRLGTKRSSFGVHRSSKVTLSLRWRDLLFRSIRDQKSNKIYVWKRPQVRSECAVGHI